MLTLLNCAKLQWLQTMLSFPLSNTAQQNNMLCKMSYRDRDMKLRDDWAHMQTAAHSIF